MFFDLVIEISLHCDLQEVTPVAADWHDGLQRSSFEWGLIGPPVSCGEFH